MKDVTDGLRFQFGNRPGLPADLAHVMELEQDRCKFLHFRLVTEANGGPISFEVIGPAGTGQMLRSL